MSKNLYVSLKKGLFYTNFPIDSFVKDSSLIIGILALLVGKCVEKDKEFCKILKKMNIISLTKQTHGLGLIAHLNQNCLYVGVFGRRYPGLGEQVVNWLKEYMQSAREKDLRYPTLKFSVFLESRRLTILIIGVIIC